MVEKFIEKPAALAYSGGLDSRYLAKTLCAAGCDLLLVHATGDHIAPRDTLYAQTFAQKNKLPMLSFLFDPLHIEGIDTKERCYVCKKALFQTMRAILEKHGESGRILIDGTNRDDHAVFRPGLRALAEENIVSPLDLAGLGKEAIRAKARAMHLDDPEQKPSPCLLTRLAYGLRADAQTLKRIAEAESTLAQALTSALGFEPALRLRLTPSPLLQVECEEESLLSQQDRVRAILDQFAFLPAKLLAEQMISGFFDREGQTKAAVVLT
ncbi:MAG: PP-loop family protein [Desulfovibrionaceae bacterium]|nr:PP-loop family protein [Desulfovibrionaceae bacterium]